MNIIIRSNLSAIQEKIPTFTAYMRKKEIWIIVLLAAINFTHILDFMIMMPLGNYLMPFFDITPRQFSFLVGAYPITAFFSGFTAAFFVDKHDRKKVLVLAYIGFLIGTLACGTSNTYALLLASRILTGLFGGLIGAQVLSIVADLFAYERRGAAMGAVMSSFAIASTIGVPLALYLANIFSWHAPFIFVVALGVVIVLLVIRFIPAMDDHIQEKDDTKHRFHVLLNVVQSRKQSLALVFSALVMMGHFLIIPFINPYLEFNKNYSRDITPLIYFFGGIASFGSAIFLGRFSDKVGKLKIFSWAVFISFGMVWIITNLPSLLPFSVVLIFFAIWFVVATGRAVTAQAMISNVVKQEQRGSFMTFNSSVQQLGTGIASLLAGFIVTKDSTGKLYRYEWVGYISIVVLLLGLLLGRYLFSGMDKTIGDKLVEELPGEDIAVKEMAGADK
jgi:MFS transporter, DHA1 family, inner membrane transport protein